MCSPNLHTLQDPILLLPWVCFEGAFQTLSVGIRMEGTHVSYDLIGGDPAAERCPWGAELRGPKHTGLRRRSVHLRGLIFFALVSRRLPSAQACRVTSRIPSAVSATWEWEGCSQTLLKRLGCQDGTVVDSVSSSLRPASAASPAPASRF